MRKDKCKATSKVHTFPLLGLPFSPELNEEYLPPVALPTSPFLKRASQRCLNGMLNNTKDSAVAEELGQYQ